MRVLLDESLPTRLKHELPGHEVSTVDDEGWNGKKNGELLRSMSGNFEVLITADRNLQHQQSIKKSTISLVVLVAYNNKFETLRKLMPQILDLLPTLQPGTVTEVR